MILKFLIILFTCFIQVSMADVIYNLPNEVDLEDVNKNITKKISNRYTNIDQIENQYKGKLKYKPTNNAIKNFREGRFFTSAAYLFNKSKFNKLINSDLEYNIIDDEQKNGYNLVFGYYFRDNMALSFEYYDYKNKEEIDTPIAINDAKGQVNKFDLQIRNYFLNLSIENNYSRFIPVFGVGIGAMSGEIQFNSSLGIDNKDFEITPIYQGFIGFDFAITDSVLLTTRYKYLGIITDPKIKIDDNKYKLKLDTGSMFSLGFKFFWN